MAEYSLYFGTHSAHKANAWILRLWLKTWACLFKTKGLKINHSLLFMYFLCIFVQSETHKTKAGIMNCCERLWATTMIKKTMSDCQKWAGLFTTTRWKGGGSGGAETTTWNKVLALHQAIWAASVSPCTFKSVFWGVSSWTWCFTGRQSCWECARSVWEFQDGRGRQTHSVTSNNGLSVYDNS